jgi:hypothetical protein
VLGLISDSNFYVPQVNLPGSMASFVLPAGVSVATAAHKRAGGLGQVSSWNYPTDPSSPPFNPNLYDLNIGGAILSGVAQYHAPFLIGGVLLLILLMKK